jgi:hypothetical protein
LGIKIKGRPLGAEELPNLKNILLLAVATLMGASEVCAQAPAAEMPAPAPIIVPPAGKKLSEGQKQEHRFWDKKNDWLFAGVGAARTLDYFSTLNFRRRGNREILLTNAIVDNHAEFAAIEAAGTAASIGVSYLFHRYGHHKLERWTSIVHIGLATTGAVRNYSLKTPHPGTAP